VYGDDILKILMVGDVSELMIHNLDRHLGPPSDREAAKDTGRQIVVCYGSVPEEVLQDSSTALVILVEPGQPERDRAVRALAATSDPALSIVEHVAADMMAERTWAIVMNLAHGIQQAVQAFRSTPVGASHLVTGAPSGGRWHAAGASPGARGATLGFVGFGPMAWGIAKSAAQAGMRISYWPQTGSRSHLVDMEQAALVSGATELPFDQVLSSATFIVLDLLYSDDSIRIIDAPELSIMQPGAYLINTAHGRAIDEGALLQALRDGRLAGVALDRFNYEPLPSDSALREVDRAVLTPGIVVPSEEELAVETARRIAMAIVNWDPSISFRSVHRRRRNRPGLT
jgi:phosphoglycerate dehydrogenase-like enzyme